MRLSFSLVFLMSFAVCDGVKGVGNDDGYPEYFPHEFASGADLLMQDDAQLPSLSSQSSQGDLLNSIKTQRTSKLLFGAFNVKNAYGAGSSRSQTGSSGSGQGGVLQGGSRLFSGIQPIPASSEFRPPPIVNASQHGSPSDQSITQPSSDQLVKGSVASVSLPMSAQVGYDFQPSNPNLASLQAASEPVGQQSSTLPIQTDIQPSGQHPLQQLSGEQLAQGSLHFGGSLYQSVAQASGQQPVHSSQESMPQHASQQPTSQNLLAQASSQQPVHSSQESMPQHASQQLTSQHLLAQANDQQPVHSSQESMPLHANEPPTSQYLSQSGYPLTLPPAVQHLVPVSYETKSLPNSLQTLDTSFQSLTQASGLQLAQGSLTMAQASGPQHAEASIQSQASSPQLAQSSYDAKLLPVSPQLYGVGNQSVGQVSHETMAQASSPPQVEASFQSAVQASDPQLAQSVYEAKPLPISSHLTGISFQSVGNAGGQQPSQAGYSVVRYTSQQTPSSRDVPQPSSQQPAKPSYQSLAQPSSQTVGSGQSGVMPVSQLAYFSSKLFSGSKQIQTTSFGSSKPGDGSGQTSYPSVTKPGSQLPTQTAIQPVPQPSGPQPPQGGHLSAALPPSRQPAQSVLQTAQNSPLPLAQHSSQQTAQASYQYGAQTSGQQPAQASYQHVTQTNSQQPVPGKYQPIPTSGIPQPAQASYPYVGQPSLQAPGRKQAVSQPQGQVFQIGSKFYTCQEIAQPSNQFVTQTGYHAPVVTQSHRPSVLSPNLEFAAGQSLSKVQSVSRHAQTSSDPAKPVQSRYQPVIQHGGMQPAQSHYQSMAQSSGPKAGYQTTPVRDQSVVQPTVLKPAPGSYQSLNQPSSPQAGYLSVPSRYQAIAQPSGQQPSTGKPQSQPQLSGQQSAPGRYQVVSLSSGQQPSTGTPQSQPQLGSQQSATGRYQFGALSSGQQPSTGTPQSQPQLGSQQSAPGRYQFGALSSGQQPSSGTPQYVPQLSDQQLAPGRYQVLGQQPSMGKPQFLAPLGGQQQSPGTAQHSKMQVSQSGYQPVAQSSSDTPWPVYRLGQSSHQSLFRVGS